MIFFNVMSQHKLLDECVYWMNVGSQIACLSHRLEWVWFKFGGKNAKLSLLGLSCLWWVINPFHPGNHICKLATLSISSTSG